jgi:hypothetical protein
MTLYKAIAFYDKIAGSYIGMGQYFPSTGTVMVCGSIQRSDIIVYFRVKV